MTNSDTTPEAALDALGRVHDSNARLAARMRRVPAWRHAAFGALFFWLIGGIAGVPVLSILPIAAAAGAVLLLRWDRNNLGYTLNNFRRGRALPYTIGLMAILVGLCFVARHVRDGGYPMIAGIGVGLAAFAVATIASVLISRTYLRELTGGEG